MRSHHRKLVGAAGFVFALSGAPVNAQDSVIPGWTMQVEHANLRAFKAPNGQGVIAEQTIPPGFTTPLRGILDGITSGMRDCGRFDPPVMRNDLGFAALQSDGRGGKNFCRVIAGQDGGRTKVLILLSPTEDFGPLMRPAETLLRNTLGRATVAGLGTLPRPVPLRQPPLAPAATGPFWATVQTVTFTMWSDMQFHPTILLKDGTSFDVGDDTLSTFDIAASRRGDAASWGRWHQAGAHYFFTDSKGNQSDHVMGEGGIFRVFPASAGLTTLNARYKSVSGSTMGEMSMLSTRAIRFATNGRFTQDNSFIATGSGDVSGVSMGGGSARQFNGRYAIAGHTIVLTFDDGRHFEKFFGFGSTGSPARASQDMIFIGHESFVTDD